MMDPKKPPLLPKRLLIFAAFSGVLLLAVWFNYARIMLFDPPSAVVDSVHFPLIERGPLLDRNGRLLAISTRLDTVTAWLPDVKAADKPATAQLLAAALGLAEKDVLDQLTPAEGFVFIKRKITPTESQKVRELKAQGLLAGIGLEVEFARTYPEKTLAAGLLGYVGTDNVGLSGLEYTFNDTLAPAEISEAGEKTGNAISLTLDVNIQYMIEQIGQRALTENQADSLNILVLGARTGEVLGMASLPSFDPNRFAEFSENQRRDRISTVAYEPGSVFKIFTMSSFLDSGSISPTDTFPCFGYYERILPSGEVIRIKDLESPGIIDAQKVLAYSSNAGAGYASDRMAAPAFETYLRNFGFGQPTGIPVVGETTGIFKSNTTWSERSKPTIAMGQEIAVSALQMVAAATVYANNGVLLKPRLVKRVTSESGVVLMEGRPEPVRQVLKPETAKLVLGMLKDVINEGTGKKARIEGLEVAGKTGTAQERDPKTGKYSEDNYLASILLFLPADQPEYIIYVTLSHPKGSSYFGGKIAAPVAKEVAEKLIQYAGLPKAGDTVLVSPGTAKLTAPQQVQLGTEIPDFTGLAKRALLPLLSKPDLQVELRGEGWVVRQSPAPGTPVTKGMSIVLELE